MHKGVTDQERTGIFDLRSQASFTRDYALFPVRLDREFSGKIEETDRQMRRCCFSIACPFLSPEIIRIVEHA